MRQTDLDILLHEGEGSMLEYLEYKESFSSSLARELVAFANRPGTAQVPRKLLSCWKRLVSQSRSNGVSWAVGET